MPAPTSRLAQVLFPVLTATLLASGCSDSTAPSPAEGSPDAPAVQSPADTSGAATLPAVPNHERTEPPTLPQLGAEDSITSSLKPGFYTKTAAYGSGYAPGPGAMNVFPRAVSCLGGFIGLDPSGITVSRTMSGLASTYNQHVVGEVFLYRLVGNTWVYQDWRRADAPLPWVAPVAQLKQNDVLMASVPGAYRVITRLTWYAAIGGVWVRIAGINVNFVHGSDYVGVLGATASSGGYCRVS